MDDAEAVVGLVADRFAKDGAVDGFHGFVVEGAWVEALEAGEDFILALRNAKGEAFLPFQTADFKGETGTDVQEVQERRLSCTVRAR